MLKRKSLITEHQAIESLLQSLTGRVPFWRGCPRTMSTEIRRHWPPPDTGWPSLIYGRSVGLQRFHGTVCFSFNWHKLFHCCKCLIHQNWNLRPIFRMIWKKVQYKLDKESIILYINSNVLINTWFCKCLNIEICRENYFLCFSFFGVQKYHRSECFHHPEVLDFSCKIDSRQQKCMASHFRIATGPLIILLNVVISRSGIDSIQWASHS